MRPSASFLCACARERIYWGDVHGHTACSDGKGTVEEYLAHARDAAGLDFVIVTDHDFGNAPPWRMPAEVWLHTQDAADAFTVDGKFVAISGYEWTSQPKHWADAPRFYNHKNAYFPGRVPYLYNAKDARYASPDQLAAALWEVGGLAHNCHPSPGPEGADQWDYSAASALVIANSEIGPDVLWHEGKQYEPGTESAVRAFLDRGGRTGFVRGTDTHEGKPAARTAVLARELTREAVFEALRQRRCYAVSHARIGLDFRIDGHVMGEDTEIEGKPEIAVAVRGTDRIDEIAIVRDGAILRAVHPATERARLAFVDETFAGASCYYVRVTQADLDEHGNPSRAWSSPIWVRGKAAGSGRLRESAVSQ
ncbi:MAG: CehA/McbA family metallohydrolase [Planctomycetes bacterium]|nr:CehA/McbA family metallohydrolase [Planctomycetota bacterium]